LLKDKIKAPRRTCTLIHRLQVYRTSTCAIGAKIVDLGRFGLPNGGLKVLCLNQLGYKSIIIITKKRKIYLKK
jgi:hypothetical protein